MSIGRLISTSGATSDGIWGSESGGWSSLGCAGGAGAGTGDGGGEGSGEGTGDCSVKSMGFELSTLALFCRGRPPDLVR